ncbi:hypothetical protein [Sphingomonas baiyangensis]|uniref:Uncharacterized protein n=1 Tax=Sphingomonas baiyangensis TaxID=2572576 RepID=A0A4V6WRH6_9SPHN|nr:hypothetical protein [Sphingomonas baiyangensis]TKD53028.1 hypothetical protein FBR43_01400 [Sphingomonas baiyangensis]
MNKRPIDTDYCALRERQERAIAERCSDPTARSAHMRLAAEYRSRIDAATPMPSPALQQA